MGAGYHGGFGATRGAKLNENIVVADSYLVGSGPGEQLRLAATKVKNIEGYTDVAVHGNPNNIAVMHNGKEIIMDHRRLANFLKSDSGYQGGKIRLLSCGTGKNPKGFAQNLANKMGVIVRAPSDTLFIYPNGKTVIGSNPLKNTGHWIDFKPERRSKK